MPLNKDIKRVLVIGSGPIVIGQAAEFDYAGTQACRALKEEGLEVILVNSYAGNGKEDNKERAPRQPAFNPRRSDRPYAFDAARKIGLPR